jgi:UDP-N-acetylglucosamine/UDP-N-acetyl-alpha-D-glucosaminouronate 4-epimerase
LSTYLVTGGAGFIGSHIAARLLTDGHDVRVLDDLSTGSLANLEVAGSGIAFRQGDICDDALLDELMDGADYVFHQAAMASVPASMEDPLACDRINVQGTLRLLTSARRAGVRRVVFASSSAVYGNSPVLPKSERMCPEPMSPYAVSKLAAEQYCCVFAASLGLECVALRYFNVYGPRQDPAGPYAAVIPIWLRCVSEGRSPVVYGDGEQSRDFVFVSDVVEANMRAAHTDGAAGLVCNIGGGAAVTLNELLGEIGRVVGRRPDADYRAERSGDVRHSVSDITRAREALGFAPRTPLPDGLRATWNAFA